MSQCPDDIELLDLMMEDYKSCRSEFRWTNYWSNKCSMLLRYLKEVGLKDFRRVNTPKGTPGAVLRSFGAVDLLSPAHNVDEMYARADEFGRRSDAVQLAHLPVSDIGNPQGFYVGDSFYTISWLNFYIRYSYVKQFFPFGDCTIAELGPGSGKQAEMIKKAYPEATILLFDIPPQLYVCNQYLKSVFPGQVADYYESREIISPEKIIKGKIYILPNWKINILESINVDLFWNAASFQEMEPDIVQNYLKIISRGSKNIYLMQHMYGQREASKPGEHGVINKTDLSHYFTYLMNTHKMIDLRHAYLSVPAKFPKWPYSDSFWVRG